MKGKIGVGIVWQSGGEEGTHGTQRKNDLAIMYVVLWKLGNENVKPVIKTETTTKQLVNWYSDTCLYEYLTPMNFYFSVIKKPYNSKTCTCNVAVLFDTDWTLLDWKQVDPTPGIYNILANFRYAKNHALTLTISIHQLPLTNRGLG